MIATITPNPAIDVTIVVGELMPGETQRTGPARRRAGGKGVNVARILHQQQIASAVLACVGGDAGREFTRDLAEAGLDAHLVQTDVATRVSRTIHEQRRGRATVLNEAGAHPGETAMHSLEDTLASLPGLTTVVISGSLPEGMGVETIIELSARGVARGAAVIVDGGGHTLTAAAAAGVSLLKPNLVELRSAAPDAPGPITAARRLINAGAGTVVVTRGEAGMLLVDADRVVSARLDRVLHGNPTGAGDAATAALAASLDDGATVDAEALRRAVAWSGSAVLSPLAGELDPSWRDLLPLVVVEESDNPQEDVWHW